MNSLPSIRARTTQCYIYMTYRLWFFTSYYWNVPSLFKNPVGNLTEAYKKLCGPLGSTLSGVRQRRFHPLVDYEYLNFSALNLDISQDWLLVPLAVAHSGDSKLNITLEHLTYELLRHFMNKSSFYMFDVSTDVNNMAYTWRLFCCLQMAWNHAQWRTAVSVSIHIPLEQK
jgi:hypothetical protein